MGFRRHASMTSRPDSAMALYQILTSAARWAIVPLPGGAPMIWLPGYSGLGAFGLSALSIVLMILTSLRGTFFTPRVVIRGPTPRSLGRAFPPRTGAAAARTGPTPRSAVSTASRTPSIVLPYFVSWVNLSAPRYLRYSSTNLSADAYRRDDDAGGRVFPTPAATCFNLSLASRFP